MLTLNRIEWISVLRATPIILGSMLIFSSADLGLAFTYAKQLYKAPLDETKLGFARDKRWSIAWFVLYSGFLPLLSLTHVILDASLFFFARLSPICTLAVSILFFIGWAIQVSIWCHCDYTPDSATCYQFYIVADPDSDMSGSLMGVSDEITVAKVAVGMIVPVLYVAYIGMAAIAVQRARKLVHVKIEDEEEEIDIAHPRENNNNFTGEHLQTLLR